MKKFTSLLMAFALVFAMSATAFASTPETEIQQGDTITITLPDENGNMVTHEIDVTEGDAEIPLYAREEGSRARSLTNVASLSISRSGNVIRFKFIPKAAVALLTLGFNGSFSLTKTSSGLSAGTSYYVGAMGGTGTCNVQCTAILVGTYYVMGYEAAPISMARNV